MMSFSFNYNPIFVMNLPSQFVLSGHNGLFTPETMFSIFQQSFVTPFARNSFALPNESLHQFFQAAFNPQAGPAAQGNGASADAVSNLKRVSVNNEV